MRGFLKSYNQDDILKLRYHYIDNYEDSQRVLVWEVNSDWVWGNIYDTDDTDFNLYENKFQQISCICPDGTGIRMIMFNFVCWGFYRRYIHCMRELKQNVEFYRHVIKQGKIETMKNIILPDIVNYVLKEFL